MKDDEIFERISKIHAEELLHARRWLYLSFADKQFNGGVVIKAQGMTDALLRMRIMEITNPGGEVMCFDVPDEMIPLERYRNRLLSKTEVVEIWPDAKSIREFEEEFGESDGS